MSSMEGTGGNLSKCTSEKEPGEVDEGPVNTPFKKCSSLLNSNEENRPRRSEKKRKRERLASKYAALGWGEVLREMPRTSGGRDAHFSPEANTCARRNRPFDEVRQGMNPNDIMRRCADMVNVGQTELPMLNDVQLRDAVLTLLELENEQKKLLLSRKSLIEYMERMQEETEQDVVAMLSLSLCAQHEAPGTPIGDLLQIIEEGKKRRQIRKALNEGTVFLPRPDASSHPYAPLPASLIEFNPFVPPPLLPSHSAQDLTSSSGSLRPRPSSIPLSSSSPHISAPPPFPSSLIGPPPPFPESGKMPVGPPPSRPVGNRSYPPLPPPLSFILPSLQQKLGYENQNEDPQKRFPVVVPDFSKPPPVARPPLPPPIVSVRIVE